MITGMTITTMTTATAMLMTIDAPRADGSGILFAWFSPAFPTGGFGYSHGIESAAADSSILGEADLLAWLTAILNQGAGWTDAVLFALAHRAARAGDADRLADLAALAAAFAPSRERLAETLGQGSAFLAAVREGWPDAAAELPRQTAYPVAAGACCGRVGASLPVALQAYLTGFCANLIAAGVRLGLCGQKGGVRVLSALGPQIGDLALRASQAEEDGLGGCAFGSDISSMRHEVLEGRLFLS
jgi:urease accessory protein